MAKSEKVNVLLLAFEETLVALAYGFAGVVATALCVGLLSVLIGKQVGLVESGLAATIIGGVAFLIGILSTGYKYLKEDKRENLLLKHFLQGVFGFIAGLAVLLLCLKIEELQSWNAFLDYAVYVAPLIGLLIGFNHRIGHRRLRAAADS
ncbi:hypothetical protein LRS06_11665 [Hymenobacter sp. J193]|uniref:hypothetical protein n=1 Tax=Hymenobacter sp. J193 TaxID=2898429 RepID=UPI0021517FDC|nr:hypothetical protein [Hymenobacter sp. J193]MCR5888411.1 hypothetical protein [Hymenobacter sp. J193]